MSVRSAGVLGLGALFSLCLGLTACGGGSGGGSDAPAPAPTPTAKSCANIAGPTDPASDALLQNLVPALQQQPQLAPVAVPLVQSVTKVTDALDALINSLQAVAMSGGGDQAPTAFFAQAPGAGDSILCASADLTQALEGLTAMGVDQPVIGDIAQQLLAMEEMVRAGFTGEGPGGNLTALTDQLVMIADQLDELAAQLPGSAPAGTPAEIVTLLGAPAIALRDLAQTLDAIGRLDGDATAAGVTALLSNLAGVFTVETFVVTLGLPPSAIAPVGTGFGNALSDFQQGMALILDPLFTALSAVLSPLAGPQAPFADVLFGGLSGSPPSGSFGELLNQLALINLEQVLGGAL